MHNGSVSHHMRRLARDEYRKGSTSDMEAPVRGTINLVSESGLYKLIMRSDKL